MNLSIELPEDISEALRSGWGDVPRRTLEAMAVEGYRSRVLSEGQIRRMLGLGSRIEVHELLKKAGVHLDIDEADLQRDVEALRRLGHLPS